MWLAGHTYAFRALPLEGALERLVRLGLRDVELWLGHVRDDVQEAVDAVERAGVRVRAVSAGGFYESSDDRPIRAFDIAATFGARLVVVCVSPRLLPELGGLAAPGIQVAVENHWDQPLARSHEVASAIQGSGFDACLDTGHALAAGERPDDFVCALGGRIAHVHLKEARLPSLGERLLGRRLRRRLFGKPEAVMPGCGDLDVSAVRKALERVGFDGCVSLEHEGDCPEKAIAALAASWRGAR